mmetsp:Transcript_141558/g.394537  ORF Transcript_141558/g.394537 Transcript_141558/m.394537 type:complete len:234 (+) Transcript_141558:216-917(+)
MRPNASGLRSSRSQRHLSGRPRPQVACAMISSACGRWPSQRSASARSARHRSWTTCSGPAWQWPVEYTAMRSSSCSISMRASWRGRRAGAAAAVRTAGSAVTKSTGNRLPCCLRCLDRSAHLSMRSWAQGPGSTTGASRSVSRSQQKLRPRRPTTTSTRCFSASPSPSACSLASRSQGSSTRLPVVASRSLSRAMCSSVSCWQSNRGRCSTDPWTRPRNCAHASMCWGVDRRC